MSNISTVKPLRKSEWFEIRAGKIRADLRHLKTVRQKHNLPVEDIRGIMKNYSIPMFFNRPYQLGKALAITFMEWKEIGMTFNRHASAFYPIDATENERVEYLKDWHRPRKAEAKRQRYAARKETGRVVKMIDCRASAQQHNQ
jgi:hypothetical protein